MLSGEGGGVSGRATHRRDTGAAVDQARVPGEGHVHCGMFNLFVFARLVVRLAHFVHRFPAAFYRYL